MLIPHETKPIEASKLLQGLFLSREIHENKSLGMELKENLMFSGKIMLLKLNNLILTTGGEEAKKKGAPK